MWELSGVMGGLIGDHRVTNYEIFSGTIREVDGSLFVVIRG